jgi:hypothetical protein
MITFKNISVSYLYLYTIPQILKSGRIYIKLKYKCGGMIQAVMRP